MVIMCGQYSRILQVVIRQIRDIAKNTPKPLLLDPPEQERSKKSVKQSSPSVNGKSSPSAFRSSPTRDRYNGQHPAEKKRGSRASRGSTDKIRYSDAGRKRWSTIALKIRDFRKELNATKTIGLVFLAFCLCWLPSAILTYIIYFKPILIKRLSLTTVNAIFYSLVDIFPMINTMINPIIYSFSNSQFRHAVNDIWRKLHGKAPKRGSIFASTQGTRLSATGQSVREHLLSPPR